MSWIEKCPLCQKDISVSSGQRVFGCGDCRKDIKAHNRKVSKRLSQRKSHGKKTNA